VGVDQRVFLPVISRTKLKMADEIARRREIRKRKILENSEKRLQALTGDQAPISDEPVLISSNIIDKPRIDEEISPNILETTDTNNDKGHKNSASANVIKELMKTLQEDNASGSFGNGLSKLLLGNSILNELNVETSSASKSIIAEDTLEGKSDDKKPTESLWYRKTSIHKLSCFILGFLTWWLLYAKVHSSLFQSAFTPFFLLEIGILSSEVFFGVNSGGPPKSSLFLTALALNGIPQDTVNIIAQVLQYSKVLMEDFCCYFFIIVILQWLAT